MRCKYPQLNEEYLIYIPPLSTYLCLDKTDAYSREEATRFDAQELLRVLNALALFHCSREVETISKNLVD